jgi:hypothetical protein
MSNNEEVQDGFSPLFLIQAKEYIDIDLSNKDKDRISQDLNYLKNIDSSDNKYIDKVIHYCINTILEAIVRDPVFWFKYTNFSRTNDYTNCEMLLNDNTKGKFDILFALFVMVYEVYLTLDPKEELNNRLVDILFFIKNNPEKLSSNYYQFKTYANNFPIFLNKHLINSPILTRLKTFDKEINEVDRVYKIVKDFNDEWESKLLQRNAKIDALEDRLKSYQSNLNFLALSKGFSDIESKKSEDLTQINRNITFWRRCIVGVPVISFITSLIFIWNEKAFDPLFFGSIATLLIIFSTFYRVSLTEVKSLKSQLVQLQLRQALCQFVEDYALKAEKISDSSPATLKKFEDIIFSSIVLSDEKIPSTFDGMDQIHKMLKSLTGK